VDTVSLVAWPAYTLVAAATARRAGIDTTPACCARPAWRTWPGAGPVPRAAVLAMAARPAASNPAIAAVSLASARSRRALLASAGLVVAAASDLRTVPRLRATHR
jgi:hypothetical protein